MVSQLEARSTENIIYPECDGNPMADNTKQFRWIMVIYYNLEWLFAKDINVFVAGDLLWYPVQGNNKLRQAPDVMVVFGVNKGDRGSYQQWREENIAPQVVFEILSPGNTLTEMSKKQVFYNRYGVEEYYLYDPDKNDLTGWLRSEGVLDVIEEMNSWVSPRLGIRFDLSGDSLQLYHPDGNPFVSYVDIQRQLEQTQEELEQTQEELEQTQQELEESQQQLEEEQQRAEKLAQRLRSLGIDPEEI
jgi:Uma2 family endonuclease